MSDFDEDEWAATLAAQELGDDMPGWDNGGGNRQPPQGGGKPKYQHRENRGSIFDNDHKTTDKHPDFSGSANIGGVLYWVSGWAELSQGGKRKMSLSFKRQEDRPQQEPRASQQRPSRW